MKCHTAGSPGNRAARRFLIAAVALTAILLIPARPRPAAAQDNSRHGWNREPVGDKGPAATPGNNAPRNAPTRLPPTDCKASARAFRHQYDVLLQQYNNSQDEDQKRAIRQQIQSLRDKWESLKSDCGDQGPLGGGEGSGVPPASGSSSSGGSPGGGAAGGGAAGGGGGGADLGSPSGAPPAAGAPPEPGLVGLIAAPYLPARPVGRPLPTATGVIHAIDRGVWNRLQQQWQRIGGLHPAGGTATPGPAEGGLPATGESPSSGSAPGSSPAASDGTPPGSFSSQPTSEPITLPPDASDTDRTGAEAVEARRAEAGDLGGYADSQERYEQADAAKDAAAMRKEAEAMLQFADRALADARRAALKQHEYEGRIVDALDAIQASIAEQGKSWPKALDDALARLRKEGLPAALRTQMAAANVPQEETDGLQTRLASYTPGDIEQGVADLKAGYHAAETVRSGFAAQGAKIDWPPPPDIAALQAAQDAARRFRQQAGPTAAIVPPVAAPAPGAAAPARRSALAGLDAWWLIPAAVVLLVLVMVVYGIRRRARRAGGSA